MHIPNTKRSQIFSRKDNIDRQIKYLDEQLEKIFKQTEDLIADGKELDKYLESGWEEQHTEEHLLSESLNLEVSIWATQRYLISDFSDSIITAREKLKASEDKNIRRV
jgi:hypothetical protein|tara:strand:+ start:439 stop:762 length:324 start_codon:yes stop_codon:yes gene_type:complete